MKIKYDEFNKELKNRIDDICHWIESIEHGYGGEIDEDEFNDTKDGICYELGSVFEKAYEDFWEYLED